MFFCEECGHPFFGDQDALATNRLVDTNQAELAKRLTWGTAHFRSQSIVIRVRDFDEPIRLAAQEEVLLGRSDTKSQTFPDLDMGPYGAAENGVSRQHASIRRGEDTLTLVDLGSTNGTHLNGQRLIPYQPRVLRDGDEVRIGKLVFHIYFE
ncbi:MAG: FHA domain-containing protein [Chloroflexi bacterium]|nr:FHA domain-containing protein [Chloroflexota bacterium]